MTATTLEISPTARYLYDLHEELDRFSTESVLEGGLEEYEAVYSAEPAETNNKLYSLIDGALMGANTVITSPSPNQDTPRHLLTIRALRAARNSRTPEFHLHKEDLCLAAELQVENSIRLNQMGTAADDQSVAAVLFGADGKPFAYSKSDGREVALAWREAVMNTAQGQKVIPAGSFFSFRYGEDGKLNVQRAMSGSGRYLISLENAGPPTNVRLFRFSAFLLQRELAESAYLNASSPEAYDTHRVYVPTVLNLGLTGVARQVQALLRKGDAYAGKLPSIAA